MPVIPINNVAPWTQCIATNNQTVFTTTWTADTETDIIVYSRGTGTSADDVANVVSTADYGVTFTVSALDKFAVVTFIGGKERTTGDIVTIIRVTPTERLNLYINTNFNPTMLNGDFNRMVMMLQQRKLSDNDLSIKYNNSETLNTGGVIDNILPLLAAGKAWRKNAGDTAIETFTVPTISVGVDVTIANDNRIMRADTSGTNQIQDSGITVDDSDVVTGMTKLTVDSLVLDGTVLNSTGALSVTSTNAMDLTPSGALTLNPTGDLKLYNAIFPTGAPAIGQVLAALTTTQLSWTTHPSIIILPTADNQLMRSEGTAGGIQGSDIIVDDSDNMSGIGTIGSGAITSTSTISGTTINGSSVVSTGLISGTTITGSSTLQGTTLNLTAATDQIVLNSTGFSTKFTTVATVNRTITFGDYTTEVVGNDTTHTLTNKTMDGDLNTFTDLAVSVLKNATDGELITWDSSGAPTTVPVGVATHVLTSNGPGAEPTFKVSAASAVDVAQGSHGFSVGDWLKVTGADTYAKAQADSTANAEVAGVVSVVAGAGNFTLQVGGTIPGLAGLTAGVVYFLSTSVAGGTQTADPTTIGQVSKPLMVATETDAAIMLTFRGKEVSSGSVVDVVDDLSPQIGANLDLNGFDIITTSNANIDLNPNGTGDVHIVSGDLDMQHNGAVLKLSDSPVVNDTPQILIGDNASFRGEIGYSEAGSTEMYIANIYNNAPAVMEFRMKGNTSAHNVLQLDGSSNVTVTSGNLIMGTSGKGIDFSTTADGTTMSSELFDDYEEGTFTPTYVGSSDPTTGYTTQLGTYTKMGRKVYFTIGLETSSLSGGSGTVTVAGLPFTPSGINNWSASGIRSLAFLGDMPKEGLVTASSPVIYLYYRTASNGASVNLAVSDLATGAGGNIMNLSGSYEV